MYGTMILMLLWGTHNLISDLEGMTGSNYFAVKVYWRVSKSINEEPTERIYQSSMVIEKSEKKAKTWIKKIRKFCIETQEEQ